MFAVSEKDAAAIRTAFEQGGEFSAALELRQRFPLIDDNSKAREQPGLSPAGSLPPQSG